MYRDLSCPSRRGASRFFAPAASSRRVFAGIASSRRGRFKDNNRPALFEVTLRLDPGRTLTAIHLDAQGAVYDSRSTTFNLFAATAIRAE